ncbi:IQ domain-containing protein IQM1 [Glycine max]|nr:IQ domain-containing protein IQM1 [Glycine max]
MEENGVIRTDGRKWVKEKEMEKMVESGLGLLAQCVCSDFALNKFQMDLLLGFETVFDSILRPGKLYRGAFLRLLRISGAQKGYGPLWTDSLSFPISACSQTISQFTSFSFCFQKCYKNMYYMWCLSLFQTCAVYKRPGSAISKTKLCCIHETIKNLTFLLPGMGMLAISKEGEVTVSFKNNINLNDFYKPEQSTSLKRRKVGNLKLQTTFSFKHLLSANCGSQEEVEDLFNKRSPMVLSKKPKQMFSPTSSDQLDLAALMIQKVYKSYRIRRNLADCAVVCEELWWKDSMITAFNRCSISSFDSDKSEKAISKWTLARKMAAKVGKDLSKDDKAQKLALRHWLEAIDPRHRYGHNLHFYYLVWFHSQSCQPFFYWLDVGGGKELNLEECPTEQLQRQRIKYLGPEEREAYEVIVEGGRLVYRQSRDLVHTTEDSKWIFVLSTSRILYVGQKKKGQFQHSSFLAGGATIASGRLVAQNGVLHAIWPYSGHYRPTEKNFMEFISFLEEHKVDMTNVKRDPIDEDVPPSNPVNEEPLFEYMEGNVGASDSANNCGKDVEENKPMSSKWTTGVGPRIGCLRVSSKFPSSGI